MYSNFMSYLVLHLKLLTYSLSAEIAPLHRLVLKQVANSKMTQIALRTGLMIKKALEAR